MRKVRILRNLTILTILSANFYIGGNNRERIFYLSKITKNDSKILISFTKDAKETKNDMTLLTLLTLSIFLIALRPIGRIKM